MSDPASPSTRPPDPAGVEAKAYAWLQREHDGLSDRDAAELRRWVAADPRHAEAFTAMRRTWARFDDFADRVVLEHPEPDLARFGLDPAAPAGAAAGRRHRWIAAGSALAATAAVLAFGLFVWREAASIPPAAMPPAALALALPAPIERRALPDGSAVELNRGADIVPDYSAARRRVRLLRGEANFTVAKDAARPFVVEAGGVEVQALGTVFNVRFDPAAVRVVVTEGRVAVAAPPDGAAVRPPAGSNDPSANSALRSPISDLPSPIYTLTLTAGQKAVVPLAAAAAPEVVNLAQSELEAELRWQPRLLDYDNAALADIAEEFNRRNPVRLVLHDADLRARRMTATIRSDNVEGFVRLLEANFGVRAERLNDREILLARQ